MTKGCVKTAPPPHEEIPNESHALYEGTDVMTRSPDPRPTKDELRKMTVNQLNAYVSRLRSELAWRKGPSHKHVIQLLEVAENVRDLRRGHEAAGEV
jgi:hypothetical protein